MNSQNLMQLLNVVMMLLPDNTAKLIIDKILDVIEDAVENTANKIDDAIVLSIVHKIRQELDVPDNDETE